MSDAPTGLVGLEFHRREALLRSLMVSPDRRTVSAGSALVEHAEAYANMRAVSAI
jgi:N-acetylglutamate synthase-like GNAT family acetyltransferase